MNQQVHTSLEHQPHLPAIISLLTTWIDRQSSSEQMTWLNQKLSRIASGDVQSLYLSFGQVTRKFPKTKLELVDVAQAQLVRKDWQPQYWSIDQTVRSLMVLSFYAPARSQYLQVIDKLFATGEVHELVALYQTLPLFPDPELFISRATEGIRTNMQVVFTAVAHHNTYPAEYLDEMSFNQMVLKAIFVGLPLYKILGLEARANAALSGMLCDYAKERWAAKRTITPELWRNVGRYASAQGLACIQKVIQEGTPLEVEAGKLALLDVENLSSQSLNSASWDELGKKVAASLQSS